MMLAKIKAWLTHPLTRGLDLDDPSSVERCRQLIQSKPSLRAIYREWYGAISRALQASLTGKIPMSGITCLACVSARLATAPRSPGGCL